MPARRSLHKFDVSDRYIGRKSFFARLSEEQIETGLRELERAVAEDPGAPSPTFAEPLLTTERSAGVR
ncbi:hypothetical protein [Paractinoplanes ferrugineus]|uniref:hypothetical protein n=1 Tax=Paractinoplanes ferrugineus TaxID=113564 RepID=UPI001944B7C6|nr:hypothetical protein [Actinoplanes ferrugineus]